MKRVDLAAMKYDYEIGLSFVKLAEKYGYANKRTPRAVLLANGVVLRKQGAVPGPRHPKWKGGRTKRGEGKYWSVRLPPTDPLFVMAAQNGYVLEHRIVMARSLGRPLTRKETVHHKNGDTLDNRLENLQLRQGQHGKGIRMTCMDCGSHNVQPAEL